MPWLSTKSNKKWSRNTNFNPIVAQGVGFEPTCLAANGFQDRLVMTASITLLVFYYQIREKWQVKSKIIKLQNCEKTARWTSFLL